MIKVSVIIPVYNTAEYLNECLDSVLCQTLKEIELICIDDGSTDISPVILDSYAAKYNNITVVHRENGGYGSAVNKGMQMACGEFIGIVDSDDFVEPDMYESLYELAKKNNSDIVKSNFFEVRKRKNGNGYNKKFISINNINSRFADTGTGKINKKDFFSYVGMNSWAGIYSIDFLRRHNIKFHESPGAFFQDNGFWFQTLLNAESLVYTEKAYYNYRKDNPHSSIHDKKKIFDICHEYEFIKKLLKEKPKLFKKYFKYYLTQKYYAYIDAYRRIAKNHKFIFLKSISSEFCEDLNTLMTPPCKADEMEPYVLGEILRIADSPEIYYYESTIDRYTELYERTHKDLEILKGSKEFKRGEGMAHIKDFITKRK